MSERFVHWCDWRKACHLCDGNLYERTIRVWGWMAECTVGAFLAWFGIFYCIIIVALFAAGLWPS